MSVSGTEAISPFFNQPGGTTTGTSGSNDKQMFLELMVAQLRYQDPLNPTDSGEFLAQSAQFTALEKMQAVADQTAMLASTQLAFGASSLIGKKVQWSDADGVLQSGVVTGATFGASGPTLTVGEEEIPLFNITSVGDTKSPSDPGTDSSTDSTGSEGTAARMGT